MPAASEFYEIRVRGELDDVRSAWFAGMSVIYAENGETLLAGAVEDQAALWGVLAKVRDLGLPLVSVQRYPERNAAKDTDAKNP